MSKHKVHYDWSDYESDMNSIDWLKFSHVIGIYRGSLPMATHISNVRDVPMSIIGFQTRDGSDKKPYWIYNAMDWNDFKEQKTILIVDDIYDTGNTINKVKELIENSSPYNCSKFDVQPNLLTYCLFGKDAPDGTNLVYSNLHQEGDWVEFPWER
tara:strand:- start:374 stop:838 length:465 start_codon:yes stop_codon:yes gene_type:complete